MAGEGGLDEGFVRERLAIAVRKPRPGRLQRRAIIGETRRVPLPEVNSCLNSAGSPKAATPIERRRSAIMKVAETNLPEFARLLTTEQGKPAAAWRPLDLPMRVIEDSVDRRVEAHRRPLGVVGARRR